MVSKGSQTFKEELGLSVYSINGHNVYSWALINKDAEDVNMTQYLGSNK